MAWIVTALALAAAQAGGASPATDRACRDDQGSDRCAEARQRQTRALFGVDPIEDLQRNGAQVRRAFYVDGYGHDLLAISLVRATGSAPTAWVHFRRDANGRLPAPLSAPLPAGMWTEILRRSRLIDRTLAARPVVNGNTDIRICLHGWMTTVEATDPAYGPGRPSTLHRAVESACDAGLGTEFAMALPDLILPLFPHCAALDPDLHRNAASQLAACRLLEGDGLAAAEAFNQALRLSRVTQADEALTIRHVFAYDAILDWGGEVSRGQTGAASAAWTRRMIAPPPYAHLYILRSRAETAGRAVVTGEIHRTIPLPNDEETRESAPVTLEFESPPNNPGFRVSRAVVGAFRAD